MARRIIQLVSTETDRHKRLGELSSHLRERGHPDLNTIAAFSKVMQPKEVPPQGDCIVFTRTYNPNHVFNQDLVKNCITGLKRPELIKAFTSKRILLATRQPSNLKKLLTSAKFELNPVPREPRQVGLVPCNRCKFCRQGYVTPSTGFSMLSSNGKIIEWTYTRLFSCNSLNILYVLLCRNCP